MTQDTLAAKNTSVSPRSRSSDTSAETRLREERRGKLWLMWSFIICPCHLPVTLAIVGALFGSTAVGAVIVSNAVATRVALGLAYTIGLGIGFRHLRRAKANGTCPIDGCEPATAYQVHR